MGVNGKSNHHSRSVVKSYTTRVVIHFTTNHNHNDVQSKEISPAGTPSKIKDNLRFFRQRRTCLRHGYFPASGGNPSLSLHIHPRGWGSTVPAACPDRLSHCSSRRSFMRRRKRPAAHPLHSIAAPACMALKKDPLIDSLHCRNQNHRSKCSTKKAKLCPLLTCLYEDTIPCLTPTKK